MYLFNLSNIMLMRLWTIFFFSLSYWKNNRYLNLKKKYVQHGFIRHYIETCYLILFPNVYQLNSNHSRSLQYIVYLKSSWHKYHVIAPVYQVNRKHLLHLSITVSIQTSIIGISRSLRANANLLHLYKKKPMLSYIFQSSCNNVNHCK